MAVVYQITNMETGHLYIGSAVRYERRVWEHRNQLRKGTHHCVALQTAWNDFGEEAFVFEILEECPDESVRQIEDTYLLKHAGQPHCYNTLASAVNSPMDFQEYRDKISNTLKARYADPAAHPRYGAKLSEESKELIRKNRKGKHAGERHYRWGKTVSEETRKKIGDTQRGRKKAPRVVSEEGMAKIRAAAERGAYSHWTGRKHTEEAKAKLRRPVAEIHSGMVFDSLSSCLQYYGMTMPTLRRALLSGEEISKGKFAGMVFQYVDEMDKE